MKIYLDREFKCHTEDAGYLSVNIDGYFDGKGKAFIEGHRYIPEGYRWTRDSKATCDGPMFLLCDDYAHVKECQDNYKEGVDSQDNTIAGLMDEIESLCNEIIMGV